MSAEFTGERVVPGQVDADLWNEHFSRYLFARRFAQGRRTLDAGCGTGYGSAELATVASSVTGLDLAGEAIASARDTFGSERVRFAEGSASAMPFRSQSFDLVVAFEVIEHLTDWQSLLTEVQRVLVPGGSFLVSTPNKAFYAETRRDNGPNPFHQHEFEYHEFLAALSAVFPQVTMYFQDHTAAVVFQPSGCEVRGEANFEMPAVPERSSFFMALCGSHPPASASAFLWVPGQANLLDEKLRHIRRLEEEVRTKDAWISSEQAAQQALLHEHQRQKQSLEESNRWALSTKAELESLQTVLVQERTENRIATEGFEAHVAELNRELESRTEWARSLETQLQALSAERARCLAALQETERNLEERTQWALNLDRQREHLEAAVQAARASRWMRLGNMIGLGPELGHSE